MIETIDAFAGRIVREYGDLTGAEAGFEVLDDADSKVLCSEIAEESILRGVREGHAGAELLVKQ